MESIDALVDDLERFLDFVRADGGPAPVVLVGHSLGGLVSCAYAERDQSQLAGLVLSAPALFVPPEILALLHAPEIPEIPLAPGVSRDPAVVEAYESDPLNYTGPLPRRFLEAMKGAAVVAEKLPSSTTPVLLMQGSADPLIPVRAFRDVVAGIGSEDLTARLWPGLFHEIFNEPEKDAVIGLLAAWLAEDHSGGGSCA